MRTLRFYLPDTNVFSAYAKGNKRLMARVEENEGSLVLSAIVLAEMEYGWQKAEVATHRIARQQSLVARLQPRAFDADCASAYGLVKNILLHRQAKNARPIGERDMLIAAHALAIDAVLVTHNTREFAGIPGLEVEDWEA